MAPKLTKRSLTGTPRTRLYRFWVSADELRQLHAGARAAKARSVSAWIRDLALRESARLERRGQRDALAPIKEAIAVIAATGQEEHDVR